MMEGFGVYCSLLLRVILSANLVTAVKFVGWMD
jgi:hypothetical protein